MQESGLVVVDKPSGMTSHDVVARIRRIAGTKKVGHAGTLDPMATGVLVLGIGRATRLLGHLMLVEKSYDATVRLGITTDTDDAEGAVTETASTASVTDEAVHDALAAFRGVIQQVPSTVSAIKVAGKRAYRLAREGEEVVLQPRTVTIHSLLVRNIGRHGDNLELDLSIDCSSGTYVRAIARDLGRALGVGGHLTALRRTKVGLFDLGDATLSLDEMQRLGRIDVVSMTDVGERLFVNLRVDDATAAAISNGKRLEIGLPESSGPVAMLGPTGELLALYEQRGDLAVPVAVLV